MLWRGNVAQEARAQAEVHSWPASASAARLPATRLSCRLACCPLACGPTWLPGTRTGLACSLGTPASPPSAPGTPACGPMLPAAHTHPALARRCAGPRSLGERRGRPCSSRRSVRLVCVLQVVCLRAARRGPAARAGPCSSQGCCSSCMPTQPAHLVDRAGPCSSHMSCSSHIRAARTRASHELPARREPRSHPPSLLLAPRRCRQRQQGLRLSVQRHQARARQPSRRP